MKPTLLRISLLLLFTGACSACFAQSTTPPQPDEAMDIFLLSILSIFFCVLIGGAVVGAAFATLCVLFVFFLLNIGILSASLGVGLYRRSLAAGFKTYLVILFSLSSSAVAVTGLLVAKPIFPSLPDHSVLVTIGLIGGVAGGVLMGLATHSLLRLFVTRLLKRFA